MNPNHGKNEVANRFVVGVFILLFFVIAVKCTAQDSIIRYSRCDGNVEVITKMPINELKFTSESNTIDIRMNIYSDSVGIDDVRYRIFVFYPANEIVKGAVLKIGFPDGSIQVLKQDRFHEESKYSEFNLTPEVKKMLSENKFDYLRFENVAQCIDIKNKTFFMDFLANN